MNSIGTNAITITIGVWKTTIATTAPMVAASEYAGAVDETPMTTLDSSPSAPVLRPLPPGPSAVAGGSAVTVMPGPPHVRSGWNGAPTASTLARRVNVHQRFPAAHADPWGPRAADVLFVRPGALRARIP